MTVKKRDHMIEVALRIHGTPLSKETYISCSCHQQTHKTGIDGDSVHAINDVPQKYIKGYKS